MSVIRYIAILSIIGTMVFKSSFGTVVPTDENGNVINSIEELLPEEDIELIDGREIEINEDISSLIAAKTEYKNSETLSKIDPGFIVNPFRENIGTIGTSTLTGIVDDNTSVNLIEGEKSTKIQVTKKIRKQKKIQGTRGTIGVSLITGTNIKTKLGEVIDPKSIDISTVSPDTMTKVKEFNKKRVKKTSSKKESKKQVETPENENSYISEAFEFGIPGKHLIFSNPVAISIDTPLYSDGISVDIAVLHAGDMEFNTSGLSSSANTLCNEDGTSTIPGSTSIVKNGKITFYTCGASSFTINPSGGTAGSNDLRIVIGDCAQVQVYYNNLTQIYYNGVTQINPPINGCTNAGPDSWPVLRVGTTNYGNKFTAWTTATTTGSSIGNTYNATSTMTAVNGGRTYTLIINWSHTAPNKYLTWNYRVIIPSGNTLPIKFYYGMDSYVAGSDANDVGYYTNTGGQTIGIYDSAANIISAFRYVNGPVWTGYQVAGYAAIKNQITNGNNYTNSITASADQGFGINWDFGTGATTHSGTVEWRLLPYVSANVADLIPGIGQPEGPLTTGYLSQLPIILTNAGNQSSTGGHTMVLTLPNSISGPTVSFIDNGWSCGAQIGTTVTCTKNTNITSLGSDTVRIPVIPLPAAGGTSVTFNVSISNVSDSNTSNNTAFATNAVVTSTITYSPGGVTGATLWLKANGNKNCNTAGCTITLWNNSGSLGVAANAVTGLGTVTYDPGTLINYNPTLYFNNAGLNTNSNLSIPTRTLSIFATTKLGTGGIFRIGPQTAVNNSLDWSTLTTLDRVAPYNATAFYNLANQRTVGSVDLTTTIRASNGSISNRTDGIQTMTSANTTNFASTNMGIGRTVNTTSAFASVGEVILYPTTLTNTDRNRVESYLGIKYGTTLNQSTPQNYILSNSSIVWNASMAGIYNQNITGISRDDTSDLNQVRSQSINNSGDIIVNSVSAIGSNYQTLMWANNGTSTGTFVTTDIASGYERIDREWQFQEKNGNIGNVKISYPNTSFPLGTTGPIYLFTSSDDIFATGLNVYTGTLNVGNWEFIVNVNDMEYITFGKNGDIVAPNITSITHASGTLLPIGNFPLIVSYSDTGSSIVAGSFTGKIYSWNGVNAWNTTNLAPSYMSVNGAATTTTGSLNIAGLPFGKYRFDISISDSTGNIRTQSYTYFVDAIEWNISSAEYDIGNIIANTQTFGSGDMIVTVKTVGAGFSLKMTGINTLAYGPETVSYWDGFEGWGYDIGGGNLGNHGGGTTIANQLKNINQNGLKNTYTYNVKYGANLNSNMVAGLFSGTVKLDLFANY
ncbi:hypothetical protein K2X92_04755 [Candidatus Gracilibacteria bacterium]|nr:hypothetical protein [Candidatus Gracilibacteria bacterium]